jgi:hypothetical protein
MIRRLLERMLASYRFRDEIEAMIRARAAHARFSDPRDVPLTPLPARYGGAAPAPRGDGAGAIFITARFRTGSTFLWQLFNQLDGFAAFYEPLNERHGPGREWDHIDQTHRGVTDYRLNFDRVGDLGHLHREAWAFDNLYMDEGDWEPDLHDYIAALASVPDVVPVLQFNRVDFRLRWLRAYFPAARIVHLYRSPREQWMSCLGREPVTRDTTPAAFEAHDRFYLLAWARDLARVYPFLHPSVHRHPYAIHYMIWRLSHAHGIRFGDVSVAYEDLVGDVAGVMAGVLARCGYPQSPAALGRLAALSDPPAAEKWPSFAPESWFAEMEADCDRILQAAFSGLFLDKA